jgi:hypothetical protein
MVSRAAAALLALALASCEPAPVPSETRVEPPARPTEPDADPEKARTLRAVAEAGAFHVGKDSYVLSDLRAVHEWLLLKPDVLHFRVPVEADLDPQRLLYLAMTVGEEHETSANGGEYVLPDIDVAGALGSADPWVVSAALFLARKQELELDAETLLQRWQSGGPWDDVCTEQALLYLAGHASTAALVGEDGVPREVAELVPMPADGFELQPWLLLSSGEWEPRLTPLDLGSGLVLEVRDSTMEPFSEREVPPGTQTLELPVTQSFYSLKYLSGAMHGQSRFTTGTPGCFVRMAVSVLGGV